MKMDGSINAVNPNIPTEVPSRNEQLEAGVKMEPQDRLKIGGSGSVAISAEELGQNVAAETPRASIKLGNHLEPQRHVAGDSKNVTLYTPKKKEAPSPGKSYSPAGLYERGMQKKIDLDIKKKKIVASLTPSFKPLLVATTKVDASPALAPRIPVWQRLHDDAKKKCQIDAHEEKSVATQPKKSVVDTDKRIDRLYRQGVEKERKRQSLPKDAKARIESEELKSCTFEPTFFTKKPQTPVHFRSKKKSSDDTNAGIFLEGAPVDKDGNSFIESDKPFSSLPEENGKV